MATSKVLRVSPASYRVLRDNATALGTTLSDLLDSILEEYYELEVEEVEEEEEYEDPVNRGPVWTPK